MLNRAVSTSAWMETYSVVVSSVVFPNDKSSVRTVGSCIFLFLMSVFILIRYTEGVQVTGGDITVVQGGTAILPCKLTDTEEKLTQISWQRSTRGNPQKENFFTVLATNGPEFVNVHNGQFQFVGSLTDLNGSLQLSNVTLMDEGTYTCIFILFPSGKHTTEILLSLLVPPVTSLKDNHPTLGNEEVSLITCTAAGSRPPAEVKWHIDSLVEMVRVTTNSTQHANGTTTTISSLFGVPTTEISNRSVQCVVTSVALSKEETLPFTIQVYFSPMEVTISGKSNNLFQCVSEANPDANFTWSRSGGSWPQSAVRAEGAMLQLLSMTSDLNGEYQCEASNPYGRKHGRLYLHVTSGACAACWTLFGVLLFLCVLSVFGAAVWYFYRFGKFSRTEEMHAVPTEEAQGGQEALELRT